MPGPWSPSPGWLIAAEQWEKDTALTAPVVGLVIGVMGGLIVKRRTGSAVSYWDPVEATLQEAVDDPLTREAQRAEVNVQRNRFTFGPLDEREDVIEAILRK